MKVMCSQCLQLVEAPLKDASETFLCGPGGTVCVRTPVAVVEPKQLVASYAQLRQRVEALLTITSFDEQQRPRPEDFRCAAIVLETAFLREGCVGVNEGSEESLIRVIVWLWKLGEGAVHEQQPRLRASRIQE